MIEESSKDNQNVKRDKNQDRGRLREVAQPQPHKSWSGKWVISLEPDE